MGNRPAQRKFHLVLIKEVKEIYQQITEQVKKLQEEYSDKINV